MECKEAPKAWITFIPNANSLHSPGATWPASEAQSARCFTLHQPVGQVPFLGKLQVRGWCQVGHNSRWETLARGQCCHNNKPDPPTLYTHASQPWAGFCAGLSFVGTEKKGEEESVGLHGLSRAHPECTAAAAAAPFPPGEFLEGRAPPGLTDGLTTQLPLWSPSPSLHSAHLPPTMASV